MVSVGVSTPRQTRAYILADNSLSLKLDPGYTENFNLEFYVLPIEPQTVSVKQSQRRLDKYIYILIKLKITKNKSGDFLCPA